jgi:hypothetical protein
MRRPNTTRADRENRPRVGHSRHKIGCSRLLAFSRDARASSGLFLRRRRSRGVCHVCGLRLGRLARSTPRCGRGLHVGFRPWLVYLQLDRTTGSRIQPDHLEVRGSRLRRGGDLLGGCHAMGSLGALNQPHSIATTVASCVPRTPNLPTCPAYPELDTGRRPRRHGRPANERQGHQSSSRRSRTSTMSCTRTPAPRASSTIPSKPRGSCS